MMSRSGRGRQNRFVNPVLFASFVVMVCSLGCMTDEEPGVEPDWGVGSRADGMGCAPSSDLCWTPRDRAAMRDIFIIESDIALQRVTAADGVDDIVDKLLLLAHKLTQEELDSLIEHEAAADALPPGATLEEIQEVYYGLRSDVITRLSATYQAAHMIPVGQMAENEQLGRADTSISESMGADGYTPGMVWSLQQLRSAGVFGKMYATMLETTGVLDVDYEVINASTFGELDPETGRVIPRGLSREARVEQIIDSYSRAGAFVGATAGAEALIPIAGVPLSVATETYALFQIHARMVFEICAVYGLDVREGRNLLPVTFMLIGDSLLVEGVDILASNVLVPVLARAVSQRLGVELSADLASNIASRSLSQILAAFSRKSQEALARTVLTEGARSLSGQILGWVTLGLTIAVSAGVDYIATQWLGERAAVSAQSWLHDLLLEGSTYLSQPEARDCAFTSFSAMAWADGAVDDREARLYQALLAKPYHVDEASWLYLDSAERVRQSSTLRDVGTMGDPQQALSCIESSFEDSLPQHKLNLLALYYAMMEIDLREDTVERELYGQVVEILSGQGLFDGPSVDEEQLQYVERAIYIMLHPGTVEIAPEYEETISGLLPEDTLDFMSNPDPEVVVDFRCGYEGVCE